MSLKSDRHCNRIKVLRHSTFSPTAPVARQLIGPQALLFIGLLPKDGSNAGRFAWSLWFTTGLSRGFQAQGTKPPGVLFGLAARSFRHRRSPCSVQCDVCFRRRTSKLMQKFVATRLRVNMVNETESRCQARFGRTKLKSRSDVLSASTYRSSGLPLSRNYTFRDNCSR